MGKMTKNKDIHGKSEEIKKVKKFTREENGRKNMAHMFSGRQKNTVKWKEIHDNINW